MGAYALGIFRLLTFTIEYTLMILGKKTPAQRLGKFYSPLRVPERFCLCVCYCKTAARAAVPRPHAKRSRIRGHAGAQTKNAAAAGRRRWPAHL